MYEKLETVIARVPSLSRLGIWSLIEPVMIITDSFTDSHGINNCQLLALISHISCEFRVVKINGPSISPHDLQP